jgi:hypothetical protein
MKEYVPDVEAGIPLPDAFPDLGPREELEMRARTIKLVADLKGTPIEPTEEDRGKAVEIAQTLMTDPSKAPALATYNNPTLAYLAGMVAQFDTLVVKELAELKVYVVNKLLVDTEHPDAKVRLTALKALGEVDGVDAFKKRTEMTVQQKSMEEVEKELLATLEKLEKRTIDVQVKEIRHENNA